jgi:hypothetical protein
MCLELSGALAKRGEVLRRPHEVDLALLRTCLFERRGFFADARGVFSQSLTLGSIRLHAPLKS